MLLECFGQWESGTAGDGGCYWYEMPSQPGSTAARADQRAQEQTMRALAKTPEAQRITQYYRELAGEVDLGPTP